ncbi:MAG TPA: NAD(P)H-hydrate dehydratase [Nocardioides sp.]|uniref:NAD(P)H-hydrate dehydratase n=1 Tax=Nocardioides sp. TaxID=35761 RepID=UPI002EDAF1BF
MRFAHTVEQVRAVEATLLAQLPEGALMQRAAAGLASALIDFLGGAYGRRVLLLVGPGDNGGDALYAGARLARRGAAVEAWLLADRAHEGGLAALRAAGGRVGAPRPLRAGAVDVVVDGIVGIGGRPGLPDHVAEAVIPIHPSIPLVAVDVPSGVDVDTGETGAMHLRADLTVTFGTHKVAHLVDPAATACGAVHLVDLGFGDASTAIGQAEMEALQPLDVARLLPHPAPHAHKYTRGVVGVRAGSATYPGAALLAVAGANTGLAGMVRYVGSAADTVKQHHPEVVGDGRVQAWVVGPGTADEAGAQLAAALEDGVPVVVDADALGEWSRHASLRSSARPPGAGGVVLTPHAGELAAMLGVERASIEAAPLRHARFAAQRYDAVVLLKGRHTLIARPDGRTRVTTVGTPWLASAGAGDVLAGVIGSLLAAGLDPFDAASVGSWVHGAAATLASAGGPLVAGQVAAAVPQVVRDLPAGPGGTMRA